MNLLVKIFRTRTSRIAAVALAVLALDQITKALVLRYLGYYEERIVIPGFFKFVHWQNTGAAWSMFTGQSTWLALLAIGTLVAVFYWRRQLGLPSPATQIAFGLLGGGIVGNLVDRIWLGHVVDFLDFHFGSYTYPTFNVADSGIFLGVVGYILWSLKQPTGTNPSP